MSGEKNKTEWALINMLYEQLRGQVQEVDAAVGGPIKNRLVLRAAAMLMIHAGLPSREKIAEALDEAEREMKPMIDREKARQAGNFPDTAFTLKPPFGGAAGDPFGPGGLTAMMDFLMGRKGPGAMPFDLGVFEKLGTEQCPCGGPHCPGTKKRARDAAAQKPV